MTIDAAVRAGDGAAVLDRIDAGADVNRRSADGFTPLMIASALGRYHIAELLLTAGADVHAVEPRMGATALHKAVQSGNPDVVGLLLNHGAFVDQQTPILGNTALIDAVLHKHERVVDQLLRHGARTGIVNHWRQSALDIARADGLSAIADRIEAHDRMGADAFAARTLVAAARDGDVAAVRDAINAGETTDQRTPIVGSVDDNYTPLGIAAREGHVEIVHILLDAGADPMPLIGLMGGLALHDATYFGHAPIVRLLAARMTRSGTSADLDVQGAYNGLSALHDAVWHGHFDCVRALVEAGARLDLKSHTGMTPRELALAYRYSEIAEYLAISATPPITE